MSEKTLFPVFAGKTEDGEGVIIYRRRGVIEELHILRPDGELWALSPNATIHTWVDPDTEVIHIRIESPEWSGKAIGSRRDLIEAEAR